MFIVIANSIVYFINQRNIENKINFVLDENISKLQIQYKSLLIHQIKTADTFNEIIINKKGFIELFSKITLSKDIDKNILRKELSEFLSNEYKIMKKGGVIQFQFVLPNNKSFLRMNQMEKFDDDLTSIRKDIVFTNKTQTISRGLVQGNNIHAFRNTYPIFGKDSQYLGALEISFGSENFQNELTTISGIYAHFLINKDVVNAKNIKKDIFLSNYIQSAENVNYVMSVTKIDKKELSIFDNKKRLTPYLEDITFKMDKGDPFSIYTRSEENNVEMISFLPIISFHDAKPNAWIISYTKNEVIYNILKAGMNLNVITFVITLIFSLFIYRQFISKKIIKKEHALLNDVVNTTDDIIFVTNLKTISFSNNKLKMFLQIDYEHDIPEIMSLFIEMTGYLHKGLLRNNENIYELFLRTLEVDRVVCILDNTMNPKAFVLNIVKSSYNEEEYLVTLTDITKLKEKELKISHQAFYDSLTGIYNRNKLNELISLELKRDQRYKRDLSIAIIDIDHFKKFNDTYGHLVGDEVLIMMSHFISKNIRDMDVFARWGGEEFVILFPETSKENALVACEKLRKGVASLNHNVAGHVTVSFGLTQFINGDSENSLLKRCDEALYKAKSDGRNRVNTI